MGSPLVTRRGDRPAFDGEELVVVTSPMFPHAIGKGYDNPFSKVVKEINGVKVKNLRHLVELLRDTKNKYTTICFRRPFLRDHRLRPQEPPQGHRRDPLRQRHPPASLGRPACAVENSKVCPTQRSSPLNLHGKAALITGPSSGIGRAIAVRLGRDGAAVVVNYSGNEPAAHDAVAAIHNAT